MEAGGFYNFWILGYWTQLWSSDVLIISGETRRVLGSLIDMAVFVILNHRQKHSTLRDGYRKPLEKYLNVFA